jgi:S1-C subfamily serine protease
VGDAKVVYVTFPDGNRYTAKVIASDIYSDIAVLQISQNASQPQQQLLSSLKPLVLGNSSNLEVVDTVIAIGNPFGLSNALTTGIVSGIGRSIPISVGGFSIPNAIQTDARNPGDSSTQVEGCACHWTSRGQRGDIHDLISIGKLVRKNASSEKVEHIISTMIEK